MDLGTIIKDTRKKKNMTQSQLSSLCGITQTYLSQIESNRKEPTLSILRAISENLKLPLPIMFFLSLTEEDIDPDKKDSFNKMNPSVKALIDEFFKI